MKSVFKCATFFICLIAYPLYAQNISFFELSELYQVDLGECYHIDEDKENRKYIASSNGLFIFDGNQIEKIPLHGMKGQEIIFLKYDDFKDRLIIVNSLFDFYQYKDDQIKAFHNPEKHIRWLGVSIHKNGLIVSTKHSKIKVIPHLSFKEPYQTDLFGVGFCLGNIGQNAILINDDRLCSYGPENELKCIEFDWNFDYIGRIRNDGDYLIGLSKDSTKINLLNTDLETVHSFNLNHYLDKDIHRIFGAKDGLFYSTNDEGTFYLNYESGESTHILDQSIKVNNIFQDSELNIWISTRNRGVLVIPNINIKVILQKGNNIFTDILATKEDLYVIENTNEIFNIKTNEYDHRVEYFNNGKGNLRNFKRCSSGEIVCIYDTRLSFGNGLTIDSKYNKDVEIFNKNVYTTTHHAFIKVNDKGEQESIEISDGNWRYFNVNAFEDSLYFTSERGLYSIDHEDRIRVILQFEDEILSNFIIDQRGNLWLISENKSLWYYNNKNHSLEQINFNQLNSNPIVKNLRVAKNKIWLIANTDVYNIDITTKKVRKLSGNFGIPKLEYNRIDIFDEKIYLMSSKKIIIFDHSLVETEESQPELYIRNILVDDVLLSEDNYINLNHNFQNLQINLANNDHSNLRKLNYFYRIINKDFDLVNEGFSTVPYVNLQNLSSGEYIFQFSKTPDFFDENHYDERNIFVSPPFWNTWWFLISVILFSLLTSYIAIRYFQKKRNERRKRTKEYLDRIQQLKLRSLQQSLNPHFINNILNAAKYYIQFESKSDGAELINRLALMMRELFNLNTSENISLQNEMRLIQRYIDLESHIHDESIKLSYDFLNIEENDLKKINLPVLLLQPIIENAIQYRNKRRLLEIKVLFEKNKNWLNIEIIDNGQGIENFDLDNSKSSLTVIKNRLALLNDKEDSLEISKNINGIGSKIKIAINLRKMDRQGNLGLRG